MPPTRKKLSEEDKKLVEDVKAELDKPELPGDDQDTDTDKPGDENSPETGDEQGEDKDTDEDSEGQESELVELIEPCRHCYPEGWPVAEEGAAANCSHDFPIFYGLAVTVSKERAAELGW